mmetsp:Transcript_119197/g.342515  ORF Transcript_119197/g.342515 Transcript_119197/m.342515 type:complete len:81 (-) Transcript_119197:437-679(-)
MKCTRMTAITVMRRITMLMTMTMTMNKNQVDQLVIVSIGMKLPWLMVLGRLDYERDNQRDKVLGLLSLHTQASFLHGAAF